MAPSSVHERCSLRQRYLDRFKGLGLRPLSADVAAGHPCIESVVHILHRRVNRSPVKPPNGQRNRTSQATGFTAHALCTLNSRTDAENRKQRNLSPYRARRGLRDRRNAAISAATAQAVKAAETNGIARSGMQVMKKLMAFIGNYKIFLAFSIVLAAITVILQLYIPILFGDAIDEVVAAHQVNFPEMWFYLKRIVFFTLVSALSAWIMNLINNRMTYRIVRDLRSQAIRHIQVLPLSYLDQHSSGDIVSRVIADTDILSDGLLLGFTQLFSGIVTIIVTLFFMFSKMRLENFFQKRIIPSFALRSNNGIPAANWHS